MAAEHRSCERFQRTELKQQRKKTQTASSLAIASFYTSAFSQRIQQNRQGRSLMRSCRDDSSTCNLEVKCSCDNIRKWTLRSHESQALARVRHRQIAFTNLQHKAMLAAPCNSGMLMLSGQTKINCDSSYLPERQDWSNLKKAKFVCWDCRAPHEHMHMQRSSELLR